MHRDDGRLLTLDAMRGLAAIMVVAFHADGAALSTLIPSGSLAVDFFSC